MSLVPAYLLIVVACVSAMIVMVVYHIVYSEQHGREVRSLKSELSSAELRASLATSHARMMEQQLRALLAQQRQAAPAKPQRRDWRVVLELGNRSHYSRDDISAAYRRLAAVRHPDKGGSVGAMAELNIARDEAMRAVAS